MRRDVVIKRLEAASNKGGALDQHLSPEVITQVASALTSNSKNLRDLVTLADVAEYYDTTTDIVSQCIEIAVEFGYLRFSIAKATLKRLHGNQLRHHHFNGGPSDSAKKQLNLIRRRFQHFADKFDQSPEFKKAINIYLDGASFSYVKGKYGFSTSEFVYLIVRKACTEMSNQEYLNLQTRLLDEYLGEFSYFALMEFIDKFRQDHYIQLQKLHSGNNDIVPIKKDLSDSFVQSFTFKWF